MNEKIESLVNATAEVGSKNRLSVNQIRQWLSDYLEMYAEDLHRFSQLDGKPHGDVLMADFDNSRPAWFIAAVFVNETVTFSAGRGEAASIRHFLERESPADASLLIQELSSRFPVTQAKVTASRQELDHWLNQQHG
jgi:hypothetical protein